MELGVFMQQTQANVSLGASCVKDPCDSSYVVQYTCESQPAWRDSRGQRRLSQNKCCCQ